MRHRLGALQLVHVPRLAHAQVLDAAEHLQRQRRLKVFGRREHAHQAVEDAAAGATKLDGHGASGAGDATPQQARGAAADQSD